VGGVERRCGYDSSGGLVVEGLTETDLGSRKARLVLKVLALARGEPVAVGVLVDLLWPDHAPARPADQAGCCCHAFVACSGRSGCHAASAVSRWRSTGSPPLLRTPARRGGLPMTDKTYTTKSGKTLTDADVEQLADEADTSATVVNRC
jgi:hypothetical protein